MKNKFKLAWFFIKLIPHYILYRLEWKAFDDWENEMTKKQIDNDENFISKSGYFIVKRKWVWILLSPVIVPIHILIAVLGILIEYFLNMGGYTMHWIPTKTKDKSFKQRMIYRFQLKP